MPTRIVSQGFEELHRRLVPSGTESEVAKRHRASIEACLSSNFGLLRFFRSGSFGNGTSVRNYSDVDYFAWLPNDNMRDSSSATLSAVADALRERFPSTFGIRADAPAVVVPFGADASETTEVIPAGIAGGGEPQVFRIADGSGGWMLSSPDAQNAYVRGVDAGCGGKAKPLIRFLKAWKYYNDVPISSFYLELVAARHAAGESTIIHSWDVKDVLAKLSESGLAAAEDPAGKSGKVSACASYERSVALEKAESARLRSKWAKESEDEGDLSSAFRWWDAVYDGKFPSRYY